MDFSIDPGSAAIASLALFVSVHSAWATRQHNKLSLRPRLTTSTLRQKASDGLNSTLHVGVNLTNVGLGPAIVKKADVLLDGEVLPVSSSTDCRELLLRAIPQAHLGPTVHFMRLNKEHAIAVGNDISIVEFTMTDAPEDINEHLERFAIVVRYESLYGEPFTYDSRGHLDALSPTSQRTMR